MRTGEEFQKAVKELGITYFHLRDCSMCGYKLAFLFSGDKVHFDSGCDCVRGPSTIRPREWEDIANIYNMQGNKSPLIKKMDKLFFPIAQSQ